MGLWVAWAMADPLHPHLGTQKPAVPMVKATA